MPSAVLKVSSLKSVNIIVLALPDDLDTTEVDRLYADLAATFADHANTRWVLDLAHVDYMGNAAPGLVVNIRFRVKSMSRQLALCQMSPRLQEISEPAAWKNSSPSRARATMHRN